MLTAVQRLSGLKCMRRPEMIGAVVLAMLAALVMPQPAEASDTPKPDELNDALPDNGRLSAGDLEAGTAESGDPTVVIALEGNDLDEPILYDASQLTSADIEKMDSVAPLSSAQKGEPGSGGAGDVTPMDTSIGLGWYIYVYGDNGDVNTWLGWGNAYLAAVLCGLASGVGSPVCSLMAKGISDSLHLNMVPSGQCIELRFSYDGILKGYKFVNGSYC